MNNAATVPASALSVPKSRNFATKRHKFIFQKPENLMDAGDQNHVCQNWRNYFVVYLDAAAEVQAHYVVNYFLASRRHIFELL